MSYSPKLLRRTFPARQKAHKSQPGLQTPLVLNGGLGVSSDTYMPQYQVTH